MKRFLVFLLAVCVFLPSCHRVSDETKEKKSRETALDERARTPLDLQLFLINRLKEENPQEMEKKADAFNQAASNAVLMGDYGRALALLPQATVLADKLAPLDQVKKLLLIADTTTRASNPQAALEILKRVMTLAENLDDADKAFIFSFVVIAMTQTDGKELIFQAFQRAVEVSQGLKNNERKTYAFSMAAIAANHMEDRWILERAIAEFYQKEKKKPVSIPRDTTLMVKILTHALAAAKLLQDSEKVWGLNWIASVYLEGEMKEQGMVIFEQALAAAKELKGLERAKRMRELASTLLLAGEGRRAEKLLGWASRAVRHSENFAKVRKLRRDARTTAKRGDQTRAEKMRQLASMIDGSVADEWLSVSIATAAAGNFKLAFELSEELDNMRKADVFQTVAGFMVRAGDRNQALQTLDQAVSMCHILQGDEKAFTLCKIASVLTQAEGREFSPQGRDLAEKILEMALK
ncbi:MAG: hypothetical protein V1746_00745 [bacterium]